MGETPFFTREPIDVPKLMESLEDVGLGGTVAFVGTVRRGEDDGPVSSIEYSAYEEMLAGEFDRLLQEAAGRWPGARVVAQHRIGRIPVGEASIVVAAAAPHRAQAFEACRYLIEEAKKRLPVWKKEFFDDGSEAWRENASAEADPNTEQA